MARCLTLIGLVGLLAWPRSAAAVTYALDTVSVAAVDGRKARGMAHILCLAGAALPVVSSARRT